MKRRELVSCQWIVTIILMFVTGISYGQEIQASKEADLNFLRNNQNWIELDVEVNTWWIYEDKNGYFWFNSSEGLCKFDGNQFYHFKYNAENPKSIPNGFITAFTIQESGQVWVGFQKLGLFLYDLKSEQVSPLFQQSRSYRNAFQ